MKLGRAVNIVRRAVKSGIAETTIKDAIFLAGNMFLRETGISRKEATVTLTASDEDVNIPEQIEDFRPERLLRAEFSDYDKLEHVDYDTIATWLRDSSESGTPEFIGFRTDTAGVVFPKPDSSHTSLRLVYLQRFANTDSYEDDTQLNLPDEYIFEVLWFGAGAVAESDVPDKTFQNVSWRKFVDEVIPKAKARTATAGVRYAHTRGRKTYERQEGHVWYPAYR